MPLLPPSGMAHYSTTTILSSVRELIQGKLNYDSQRPRYAPTLELVSDTK